MLNSIYSIVMQVLGGMSHQKSVLTWNTHSALGNIGLSRNCSSSYMWFDLVMPHPRAFGPRVRHHSVKPHVALGTVQLKLMSPRAECVIHLMMMMMMIYQNCD